MSRLAEGEREATMAALEYFLENMDRKHLQPTYPHKKSSEKYNNEERKEHELMVKGMV